MNCIIIEDQAPAQRILKKYIEDIESLTLQASFSNAIQAMDFLKSNTTELIFLDIHLPKISGIDFLRTIPNAPHIILTTAFPDYALESYEFNVVDYLLKPFSFQRFLKAVAKIPETASNSSESNSLPAVEAFAKSLFIKVGYEHVKIIVADILYIKSDADYTELFLPNKKHVSAEPLRYWEKNLDPLQFLRIQKSFIVNTTKIERIAGNQVYLVGGISIPIGRAYKEQFMRFIDKIQ